MFPVWVIICVTTHVIRAVYEILKHKKILKAGKLTFVIMFINMALLWISWFELCTKDIYRIELYPFVRYLGISLFGIGIIMFIIALFTIKTLENFEGDLITNGIYSVTRHPMYAGFILWLVGEILPIISGLLFIGTGMFSGFALIGTLFPIIFIILYVVQRKYLVY